MAFEKGHKKMGGRVKGSKNKKQPIVRERLIDITSTDRFWEKYITELFTLDGREFCGHAKEIFALIEPKLQAIAVDAVDDQAQSGAMAKINALRARLIEEEDTKE